MSLLENHYRNISDQSCADGSSSNPLRLPYTAQAPGASNAWLQVRKAENGYVVTCNGKEYIFKSLYELAAHFASKEEG